MAKRRSAEQIAELEAQAAAARRAAETATDIFTQDLSYAAAATLESVARSQLRQMPAPILAPLSNLLLNLKDVQSHLMRPDFESEAAT